MTIKLITAWIPGDASGAKSVEKLRNTLAATGRMVSVVPRAGFAVAEFEVNSRPELVRLRDLLREDFGSDFSLEQTRLDHVKAIEDLAHRADAAAIKVGCERVGLAQPLTDALGEARGVRLYYSAPAVALRRELRAAGLEPDQEQVRIRVDVWAPIPPPSPSELEGVVQPIQAKNPSKGEGEG